jgi:hypothetical protein
MHEFHWRNIKSVEIYFVAKSDPIYEIGIPKLDLNYRIDPN